MATHDYVIANASGAAVRADLNNALAAIVSNNSNATEPATTYPYMWWYDTTDEKLKQRNSTNDDWIIVQDSDALSIDSTGRVGIGTTSPTLPLIVLKDSSSSFLGTAVRVAGFGNAAGNRGVGVVYDDSTISAGLYSFGSSSTLKFFTPTGSTYKERVTIDNSGNVYFDYARSQVNYGGVLWAPASSNSMVQYSGSSTTSGISLIVFRNPNGIVGSISTSGSATTYSTSSDYRLKENITPVTDGIARLQQLKPSRFNFIADPKTNVDGFIAHEVQAVVPEAVFGEKDAVDENGDIAPQGIDQSKLVPLLTAALQEAVAKIEIQDAAIAALEARLAALEAN